MTPNRIPTLGNREKVALEIIVRFIFVVSIPSACPAQYALTRKITQTTATKAMIPPQIRYIGTLFN